MHYNYKKSVLTTAISLALVGSPSLMAEEQKANINKDKIEIIEVTGFKGSLLRSLNNKRLAEGVSDSIFSEDIGKSADQDIGEALQRITGISIQRGGGVGDNGDSTTVSVRGASPDLNVISLNGVTVTSSSENQTVDLSAFSSDILNSIEVIKTAAADQDEGSLGGSVVLKTFRPLDVNKNKRVIELQGRHSEFADEQDYKISGSFSEKLLDDSLGFYVTAFKETQAYRQDRYFANGFKTQTFANALNKKTGEAINEPTTGYVNDQNGYSLSTNQLEREGFTTAIQWQPTDSTEVLLDVTMSDQYVAYDEATFTIIGPNDKYLPEDPVATGEDPWVVYNPDNQRFEKVLNRYSRGRIAQQENGIETTNRIYSLDVNHYFTDTFSMNFRAGYSKTVADDDYYTLVNTNNFAHVTDAQTEPLAVGVVEPVGYDCTSGKCLARFGTGLVSFGPDIDGVPQTGAIGEDPSDNYATTMFNPDDLNGIHLQQLNTRDRDMSDEQKQFNLDFDYETEWGYITSVEFGAKYQKRNKDVFNQNNFFENADDAWVEDGLPTPSLGEGVASIRLDQVTRGLTKHGDDFLSILGYPRDNATDGWYTIDGQKALDLLFTTPDVRRRPDLSNDRQVELENQAIYFKMNFSLLDDDLTGNIGIRYVESSVDSVGYSGVKHKTGPFASDYNLILIAADSSQPACTPEQLYLNGVEFADNADGIGGAKLAGGLDANGVWGPAKGQSCYDANFNDTPNNRSRYWYAPGLGVDPDQYKATGSNTYENWLPSLSLNYQLNNETVIRAAVSTTMARPKIDSLKPSYTLNHLLWSGGDSGGTISNPNLVALESNNIDLSYEWYFNEGGVLSAAIFYKDMTNFEETATRSEHWIDLRGYSTEQLQALEPLDALIQPNADGSPKTVFEEPNCMPNFRHRWESNSIDLVTQCDTINVNVLRNGKGASIKGLEFGYNQNYDFLPGIWSGLGVAANYTYSDSKTKAEIIGFDTQLSSLPLDNVSKHQYNISAFWEKDGNLIRLAYNDRSDSLSRRSFRNGAIWNEGGGSLDLSATYKYSEMITFTFNATNLTERVFRQYYTNLVDSTFELEGNALEGEANKSRTVREWATGTTYRAAMRITF